MKLLCPQCDTPISGNECSCGFRYVDRRQRQLELQLQPVRREKERPVFRPPSGGR